MPSRPFDLGFDVELLQPTTLAEALLAAMGEARTARREFRAKSAKAREMEVRAIERKGKYLNESAVGMSREEWIETEIAKRCEELARL